MEIVKRLNNHQYKIDKFFEYAQFGRLDEIKKFVEKDEFNDFNGCSAGYEFSILMLASHNDHIEVIKYIIDKGADVNFLNGCNENALTILAQNEIGYHKKL